MVDPRRVRDQTFFENFVVLALEPMQGSATDQDDPRAREIAVELYFDQATEEAILRLRNALYDAEIVPRPGLIRSRPHLSLTILEGDDVPIEPLRAFAENTPSRPIRFTSLSTFAGAAGVVFLAPTPDGGLLDLHRALHERLVEASFASRPDYRPESWVPHCTLEKDVPKAQLGRAFEVLSQAFVTIEGRLTEVGAVRYPPLEPIEIATLGNDGMIRGSGADA